MPRRRREDKRRSEHDPLDVMVVLAETSLRGCRAVPDGMTLDDLYGAWSQLQVTRKDTWADRAFRQGVERPCEGLRSAADAFDPDARTPRMRCLASRCLFGGPVDTTGDA